MTTDGSALLESLRAERRRLEVAMEEENPERPLEFAQAFLERRGAELPLEFRSEVFDLWLSGYRYGQDRREGAITKEKIKAYSAVAKLSVILMSLVAIGVTLLGGYMTYRGVTGDAEIMFLGQRIKSTIVGVPTAFIGVVGLYGVVRLVMKSLRVL